MITTAKRLNTIEEYYFSSKLRVRQLAAEGKPIINMGMEVQIYCRRKR
jgi:hypothetical protein